MPVEGPRCSEPPIFAVAVGRLDVGLLSPLPAHLAKHVYRAGLLQAVVRLVAVDAGRLACLAQRVDGHRAAVTAQRHVEAESITRIRVRCLEVTDGLEHVTSREQRLRVAAARGVAGRESE